MKKTLFAAAALLTLAAAPGQERVKWTYDLTAAINQAKSTGNHLIAVYTTWHVNCTEGKCCEHLDEADREAMRGFGEKIVASNRDRFIFVRANNKIAEKLDIREAPYLVILDPDGDRLCGCRVAECGDVTALIGMALEKWSCTEPWGDNVEEAVAAAKKEGRLVLAFFMDQKRDKFNEEMERSIRHPYAIKAAPRRAWARTLYGDKSDLCKKYDVARPGFVAIDPILGKTIGQMVTPQPPPKLQEWLSRMAAQNTKIDNPNLKGPGQ